MSRHSKRAPAIGLGLAAALLSTSVVGCGVKENNAQTPEETQRALTHCGTDPQNGQNVAESAPGQDHPDEATTDRSNTSLRIDAPNAFAIATPDPSATYVGCRVLAQGGTAADATFAAQMMLGLTEPQSSGPGGGAISVYYSAEENKLFSFDGTVNAPTEDTNNPDHAGAVARVGVPRTLELMRALHKDHGKLDKHELLQPVIDRATAGFTPSTRLREAVDSRPELFTSTHTQHLDYLRTLGNAGDGARVTNLAYAETIRRIASGESILDVGDSARDSLVAQIGEQTLDLQRAEDSASSKKTKKEDRVSQQKTLIGDWSAAEEQQATTRADEATCTDYRGKQVCGNSSPATGSVFVTQALNIISHLPENKVSGNSFFSTPTAKPNSNSSSGTVNGDGVSVNRELLSEVQRVVMANANTYMGDPRTAPRVAEEYVKAIVRNGDRAGKDAEDILNNRVKKEPEPHKLTDAAGDYNDFEEDGTSQISVKDRYGNVASTTTTLQKNFGAGIFIHGFFLNNSLDNFSSQQAEGERANTRRASAHPKTMMAPLILADGGRGFAALGSPGGSKIPSYVLKSVIGLVDLHLDPTAAVLRPNYGALTRSKVYVESEPPEGPGAPGSQGALEPSETPRTGKDHPDGRRTTASNDNTKARRVTAKADSGISIVATTGDALEGAADPRRSGLVLGGSKDA
ncbi:gamma-glutamyltransferase [Corynebacterium auriscanis]|uniref:gamma-glutamyltransferase n=2 Tax=Corynebacterium auriscanis TaxID=99807 RepID=UPI003CEC46EF